jgi:hypothetical protein
MYVVSEIQKTSLNFGQHVFEKKMYLGAENSLLKFKVPRAIPLTYFYQRKKFVINFFRE